MSEQTFEFWLFWSAFVTLVFGQLAPSLLGLALIGAASWWYYAGHRIADNPDS